MSILFWTYIYVVGFIGPYLAILTPGIGIPMMVAWLVMLIYLGTQRGKHLLWGREPNDRNACGLTDQAIYNRWGEVKGARYIAQRDEAQSWRYRRIRWLRDHPELTPYVASIITEDDARYIYGDEAVDAFNRRHTT